MKSWDLHVCDRASTITHIDRVKINNPWYNKIWLCSNVTMWSSQICLSVVFIHFVKISKYLGKKVHLFTLFSITSHCFSLFLVGSKSMLALLPFKATITPRHWNDKCWWGLDLPILPSRITFPMYSGCATRNPVPDSTYHLADLKSGHGISESHSGRPQENHLDWSLSNNASKFGPPNPWNMDYA